MTDERGEDTGLLASEPTGSWRSGCEQEQALLEGQRRYSQEEYRNWRNEKSIDDDDFENGWCTIRWWHLIVLLVLCTLSVPLAVNLIHKGSYRHGDSVAPESTATQKVQEDYVLNPEWDFSAAPTLREYVWTVTETEYNPDGVYRPMLLINNQFPGPLIEVNEGDTLRVTVHNQMTNSTAFHWHGIFQNGTNWMDGTVGITQCPIGPGHTFTYEFTVDNQSGTYWYHAHQGVQASDGLAGPLIIHSKDEKDLQQIEYATDRVVMVSDHYHDLSGALARHYLAPDMENAEPIPDGALINGRAIRNCDEYEDRKCDNSTSNVGTPVFNLESDQHHRLRIINVGAFAEFQFQVDEHQLAVTEADGTDVVPTWYHRLNINPAQRYSVILHANSSSSDSFRMRARMITTCFAETKPHMAGEVQGIVRYRKADESTAVEMPDSKDWNEAQQLECHDLNTTELVPVQVVAAPEKADAFFYVRSNFEIGAYRLSRGYFNSSSWRADVHSPTLSRAVDGLQTGNASYSPSARQTEKGSAGTTFVNDVAFESGRELVIQSSAIQTIDVLVSNFDDGNHPMHLHGYKYFVLAQGHGSPPLRSVLDPPDRANLAPLYDSLDLSNPLRRDTASVEGFGWMLIRFVADNPGAWAFHCHIAWHTEAGLLMQFLTRTDLLAHVQLPEAHQALCAAQGLEKGAGPKDEIYYDEA